MLQKTTFALIVVDGDPGSSQVVHSGDVYRPQSFASGLEGMLLSAFQAMLSDGVSHVQVTTSLVVGPKNVQHLVEIGERTLIFGLNMNYSFNGYKQARRANAGLLYNAINLLGWKFASPEERFFVGRNPLVSRSCILCGHTQVCERSVEPPYTISNVWPSDFCTDSSCLSHEIQRKIIPNYEIPGVAIARA